MAEKAPKAAARRVVDSPFGRLRLEARDGALVSAAWIGSDESAPEDADCDLLVEAERQLADYFARRRRSFELPLEPAVGTFERAVLAAMSAIPFGETRTYGTLAAALSAMPQEIGQACGANPLPVFIPCHRVVAAKGQLGGYSGGAGVETKAALLRHEGALLL
ncbi:MAG: methylated-DNA--[protein]-cysteine S-methyltransferase [Kiloniellales bacterium]